MCSVPDISLMVCCNKKYNYFSRINTIDVMSYNDAYREAMERMEDYNEDMQHVTMEILKERGCLEYERIEV